MMPSVRASSKKLSISRSLSRVTRSRSERCSANSSPSWSRQARSYDASASASRRSRREGVDRDAATPASRSECCSESRRRSSASPARRHRRRRACDRRTCDRWRRAAEASAGAVRGVIVDAPRLRDTRQHARVAAERVAGGHDAHADVGARLADNRHRPRESAGRDVVAEMQFDVAGMPGDELALSGVQVACAAAPDRSAAGTRSSRRRP